jgi:hypothetical protein
MVTVPGFLLRRLYLKGSLRNTSSGFEFQLRNRLGSGYAHKLWPLTVDGVELPLEATSFESKDTPTRFSEVSGENTFTLALNRVIIIRADGGTLETGARKIGMGFDVPGLGTLSFDFTDVVADG